ncbi:EndoU domain-containing protein [Bacillus sp. DX1.1]|uniref:EndoU domain-containing protein n=1 Tax=unclassified Bacillus (in: firmicutes) TaxID=185979 RepID=UPI0025705EFE|nr:MULTISPECIES: EndoU domain-containing protein [unclassified Bacillus (in: firmicutes)]MDM5154718.1 EndoU domain-containing protein [Bacillus sp. DX1.1]WJE83605.1 EndoU domain-containing protein [Bacillus sp. DX3.1]
MPSKVKEGVSFLASKAKGLGNKVGDLWNKGKTKVKNDFIEIDTAFKRAVKTLREFEWIPDGGSSFAMEGVGAISGGGKNLLKDAYQFMKETGEKVVGKGTGEAAKSVIEKKEWLESLKNTENFKQGTKENALNHIFDGEILKNGNANGFHYEGMPNSNGKVVGNIDPPSEFGAYRANIEVSGVPKNPKSTFFPREWTPQQVIDAINEAFNNKEVFKNNKFRGSTDTGMVIEMVIKKDKIVSAYPLH